MTRLYLSPPATGALERTHLLRALESNWIAPFGPDLDAFEDEIAERCSRTHAVALSSGTAALHLALLALNVRPGDPVVVPTLTFVAAANAVRYVGAQPAFIDSEVDSWNMDPEALESELERREREGTLPAAVVVVDIYGQCADYDRILASCSRRQIPVVADAAESLGATHHDKPAGGLGDIAVLSFAGNKIVTTSSGGMLLTHDPKLSERARHLANQARVPAQHYEHDDVGFNYRMSNVLASLGRAQLATLEQRLECRAETHRRYREGLGDLDGVSFQPQAPWGHPNHWLTCITVDPATGRTRDDVLAALEESDIESRPTWKPMHRQPLYQGSPAVLTGVADRLFDTGLCLPSGTAMSADEQRRVLDVVRSVLDGAGFAHRRRNGPTAQSQQISPAR